MLTSLAIMNVATRVRFAWKASAIMSNMVSSCLPKSSGTPMGASGSFTPVPSFSFCFCDAPLDLAHGVQVVGDHGLVGGAELALQIRGALLDAVEDAARLVHDRVTLGGVSPWPNSR